ncbi:hypothetical protein [Brevibacterium senegalense]|uniref:hypothetical protein n=1 Tax=Brevibacterium senegalense TaxID=1033736 RepID=UPI0002E85076|nr:hypothetical protein [Brevibacterium senegalense]
MRTVLAALAARRHPVLRWEDGDGAALELTGPVLANWVHKAHGLLADLDVGPHRGLGLVVGADEPLHWRALAGALAAWGLGSPVLLVTDEPPADEWIALVPEALAQDPVTDSADEVLVFPVAPLALAADAPPETIDFATALRAFPDESAIAASPRVTLGEAAAPQTVQLAELTAGGPSGDPTGRSSDTTAEAAVSTEVALTSAPRTAGDWTRVLDGLLQGLLVLRPAD